MKRFELVKKKKKFGFSLRYVDWIFFKTFSGGVRLSPNVALGKGEATQSRDHVTGGFTGSPFVAAYAIDGNFETSMKLPAKGLVQ